MAFMKFDMNLTVDIDRSRNIGITNLMKKVMQWFSNEIAYSLHSAGFMDLL